MITRKVKHVVVFALALGLVMAVFSIDTNGNNYTVQHDFPGGDQDGATSDHGYVVQSGHHLYGMTTNGGLS